MVPPQPKARLVYSVRPPQGWLVESFAEGFTVVHSPDWEAFCLIEYKPGGDPHSDVKDIINKGQFHGSFLFHKPKVPHIAASTSSDSVSATVAFSTYNETEAHASLECFRKGGFIVLLAFAAPVTMFEKLSATLRSCIVLPDHPVTEPDQRFSLHNPAMMIHAAADMKLPGGSLVENLNKPALGPAHDAPPSAAHVAATAADRAARSFNNMDAYIRGEDHPSPAHGPSPANMMGSLNMSPLPVPTPQPAPHKLAPAPPVGAPLPPPLPPSQWVHYTEPEMGTYVMEVPSGWTIHGGFKHPMPGDRRPWFQATSPEHIFIACDPVMPQSFCHFRDQVEGQYAVMAAGGQLLNLRPSAERMGDYFVQNVASQGFGALQKLQRRPRPDVVAMIQMLLKQVGIVVTPKFQITVDEQLFLVSRDGQEHQLSVLSSAVFNGEYMMWNWGFWDGNVCIYVAPPNLAARAEEVRSRMQRTMQRTPRLMQIYQQDEAQIAANARTAHANQVNWFNQEQAAHNAQNAIGDSIVASYWRR